MSKKRYFDLLITDLDGTLVDSELLVVNCVKYAARQCGLAVPRKHDILEAYYEAPSPSKLLKKFGMEQESDKKAFWEYYEENLDMLTLKDAGIVKSLEVMRLEGLEIGLVTSLNESYARKVLDFFDIEEFFQEERFYKWGYPKHRAIAEIMQHLDVESESTIYLGDSPTDIASARRANCWSGAVAWENAKLADCLEEEPEFLFYDFKMVLDLLLTRITNQEDYFTPSDKCYIPHTKYVKNEHLIPRLSCSNCWFQSDCWNCAKFQEVERVPFDDAFLVSLRGAALKSVVATEWYVDQRSAPGNDIGVIVRRLKSGYHEPLFRIALAVYRCLLEVSKVNRKYRNVDCIIPVPPSKKRLQEMTLNPPEEICKVIENLTGISYITPLKRKSKWSMREIRGDHEIEKRIRKIQSDLEIIGKPRIKNKTILLIDDVITDGTTLIGVSRKLYEASEETSTIIGLTFGCTRKNR